MGPKVSGARKMLFKKLMVRKFFVNKIVGKQKISSKRIFDQTKIVGPKIFESKRYLGQKKSVP